jgi:hypothetical protein
MTSGLRAVSWLASLLRLICATDLFDLIRRKEMKKKLFLFVLMTLLFAMVAGCGPATVTPTNTPIPNKQAGTPASNGQIDVPAISIQIYIPGPNPLVNTADGHGYSAGILLGIWHGVISPVTLIWSFINPSIQMYEVHNNGSQYNLGFLVGVAIIFLFLGVFAGSRRR